MARPQKERVICTMPSGSLFHAHKGVVEEVVSLTLDEYEVVRLHDLEHLEQKQIAAQMLISRPTVAALLNSAHFKLADAIINGKQVRIEGGNCRICEIGAACPKQRTDGECPKRYRCRASCRCGKQTNS